MDNLELSCYWCNNAKTDEFKSDEFQSIGREIGKVMRSRLGGNTIGANDENTNFLYLSGLLKEKHESFYERLIPVLEKNHIDYPLKNDKNRETISDVTAICGAIDVPVVKSDIVLDGGNLVRFGSNAILTSKIFKENPGSSETELLRSLEDLLLVSKIFIIPPEPGDWLGHADGMVRFLDEGRVLINDYSREKEKEYYRSLRMSLRNAGLELIELPYNPYENTSKDNAKGVYINFLRMKEFVLVPAFGLAEDEKAVSVLSVLFSGSRMDTVQSGEIAKDGGVLNCISWNIQR